MVDEKKEEGRYWKKRYIERNGKGGKMLEEKIYRGERRRREDIRREKL